MSEDAMLSGLIVRNIGDIEAAIAMADHILDTQFLNEVEQCAAGSEWDTKRDEEGLTYLTKQDWLLADGDEEEAEFCLSFDEIPGVNGEFVWTWIATATGSGPNGAKLGLVFEQDPITPARFKKLLANSPDLITRLRNHQFELDASGKKLFIPIGIDPALLARAFEEEDFDAALEPVQTAVRSASAAANDLDLLAELVRADAAK
jgi:hypothetical protein